MEKSKASNIRRIAGEGHPVAFRPIEAQQQETVKEAFIMPQTKPITKAMTLREIAMLPLLRDQFSFFIHHMDLTDMPAWERTLDENERLGGWCADSVVEGLNRLQSQMATGRCLYSVYTEEEIASDPEKAFARLLFFPSDDEKADARPYVMVVPGGGYRNVWELTEGYPIAAQFNRVGYHAFVLSYRTLIPGLFPRPLEDFARALAFIRGHAAIFPVRWDHYAAVGFSAGANLILNWAMPHKGWQVYGMPAPKALMPIYAPVSWRLRRGGPDTMTLRTFGLKASEMAESDWNAEDYAAAFPPCYIACCADDAMVNPEHSRLLKRALDKANVPAVLEMGEKGGHGFGDGRKADTKGWIGRAAAFLDQYAK